MQGVIRLGERLVTILNPLAILADEAEQNSD
jgi:chemotaxis signal transduction protein